MYNGIGPKTNKVVTDSSKGFDLDQGTAGVSRKPNKDILEHDRKRQIELKLIVLEDKLVDQGYTEAEIAEKLDEARKSLEAKDNDNDDGGSLSKPRITIATMENNNNQEEDHITWMSSLGILAKGG